MNINHSKECIPDLSLKVALLPSYIPASSEQQDTFKLQCSFPPLCFLVCSPFWGGEYFQCSNPIETHVRLASAMLLPPTSIGGHHFFLKYQMMNGWLSSAQLLIIAHGIFQSHPCPSIDGTHFCFSLSIFSIYYAPSLSLTKL